MTARAINWRNLGLGKMNPLPPRAKAKRRRKVQLRPVKAAPAAEVVELTLAELGAPRGQRIICDYPPNALNPNRLTNRWDKAKAAKPYRQDCFVLARASGVTAPAEGRIAVRLDIFPPDDGAKRDDDNAEASFKAGRDGIAQALKVDDSRFDIQRHFHPACRLGCIVFTIVDGAAR